MTVYKPHRKKAPGYYLPNAVPELPLREEIEPAEFREMFRQRITMEPRRPEEPPPIDRRKDVCPWLTDSQR